jgi:hypothetical protein
MLLSPSPARDAVLLQSTTFCRAGVREKPKPDPLTSATFDRKTLPVPQPSRIS